MDTNIEYLKQEDAFAAAIKAKVSFWGFKNDNAIYVIHESIPYRMTIHKWYQDTHRWSWKWERAINTAMIAEGLVG